MSNALHDYAKLFERYAANNGGTGAILAGEDCLSLANEMRMDADVIDAENAKLREQIVQLQADWESERDYANQMEAKEKQAVAENAKLRELAKLYADVVSLDCDICPYCDPDLCETETVPMRDECRLWEEMHELGVEVKP